LKEDEMSGTTDGEEFCYSLNNTEEDSLEDIDFDAPSLILNNRRY
jgi:hypothetical protein